MKWGLGGILRNSHGVTLVELTIAVGLVGVSTLALTSLLASYTQQTAHQQFEANLAEELLGFSELLESHLANATLIDACGCGPVTARCLYSDLRDCTDPLASGCTNTALLRFEFEDSTDPSIPAPANCNFGGATFPRTITPHAMIPRGCKHRARLIYEPPVSAAAGAPRAGRLLLVREDAQGVLDTAGVDVTPQPIFSVSGVTSFKCGHPDNPARPGFPATGSFRFSIGAKARANNFAPGNAAFDGWHPADPLFLRGTHRSLTTDVALRNMNTAGLQFGKATTDRNCTIDGAVNPVANCCSGYWDPGTQTCTAMANCRVRGAAASSFTQCCSHMQMTDTGQCL